jgi:hypothetical protein
MYNCTPKRSQSQTKNPSQNTLFSRLISLVDGSGKGGVL